MFRTIFRGALVLGLAVGLTGCSTHQGPPSRDVKLAYVSELLGHPIHWPRHHRTFIYKALERSRIQQCRPTNKPDVWACSMYFRELHDVRGHARVIELIREGHQWTLYHPHRQRLSNSAY